MINIPVIYEDKYVLILNKPAGVVVNRAESVKSFTIQDWFEAVYPEIISGLDSDSESDQVFRQRSGMVHRLDKDTSGVLIWSKTSQVMHALMEQFKLRQVDKTYQALVYDVLRPESGKINLPIGRTLKDRRKFGVVIGGKMTQTNYQVMGYYKNKRNQVFSLVNLEPKTGRTHQLRVVLKHLNHPIVGDEFYVSKKRFKKDKHWCARQFLHAYEISLVHPMTKKLVQWQAPLAEDLAKGLSSLEQISI